ncbi:SDR family oxidoreductase [Nitratireductor basaltis]|uniref:Short-chain dehydrogenase n=1 Tax=Nitratireductor basaltis TaxID=472175 RepID=A0A084U8R4_9HYPH|nr:SDR family oxidoreductase [Nitratireductor basaltis]KFB09350.1 Short-chain dehydrogenase [Nitratireductor basaltis]
MAGRLEQKVAIVTGAGQGIGAAIARAFAAEGANVVVAELNAVTGQAVADEIGGIFVETDVTKQVHVDAVVAATTEAFGRIDILVNNAGANVFHRPHEMPRTEWARCMALDLEACWAMSEAVLSPMRRQGGGSIINIASTHGFKIIPATFPYPVAKHGLIGLTRSLGIEYAAEGLRVNAIAPGYIDTEIARDYWANFADPGAERRRAEELHPPRRIGTPEEVAMTAVFLASDEAPFINAETIVIDGGRSALYHD